MRRRAAATVAAARLLEYSLEALSGTQRELSARSCQTPLIRADRNKAKHAVDLCFENLGIDEALSRLSRHWALNAINQRKRQEQMHDNPERPGSAES
eukprot:1055887-Alexandrium_andersonii.AAC.1